MADNGRLKIRPNLVIAQITLVLLCGMGVALSVLVWLLMRDMNAAQTIGEVKQYSEQIIKLILVGGGSLGVGLTIIGGLIFKLSDEKAPAGPTVPLEVHQQALENNAKHTDHLANIAQGMAYIPGVVEKVRTVADKLEKENE